MSAEAWAWCGECAREQIVCCGHVYSPQKIAATEAADWVLTDGSLLDAWARAVDEGWRPKPIFGVAMSRVGPFFLRVYSGDLAAVYAGSRPVCAYGRVVLDRMVVCSGSFGG